jgi:HTH-type transcriptional repressor of NAD biosynthesis genes
MGTITLHQSGGTNMTVGLVLGKFAPLHKGHQSLIERALQENDHVKVVIYQATEVTAIPLAKRAGWIRQLYPTVEVVEAPDGPTEVGYTPEIMLRHEKYLLAKLQGAGISKFYSSEPYGHHISQALGAADCRLDPDRQKIPISGTQIRANLWENRHYLSPEVYWDMLTKVCFLGAPSTGKTTIAQELARQRKTTWVPEYGRQYWEEHQVNRRLTPSQLADLAQGHLQLEYQTALEGRRELFIDTNAITTRLFSVYWHGKADPQLERLAQKALSRYDLFFLCEDDIPYENTWDRSGQACRTEMQALTRHYLQEKNIPHIKLTGSLEKRITRVTQLLNQPAFPNAQLWL